MRNKLKLVAGWLMPVAAVFMAMEGWPDTPQEWCSLVMAALGSLGGVTYKPRASKPKLEPPE